MFNLNNFKTKKAVRYTLTFYLITAFIVGPLAGGLAHAASTPSMEATDQITPGLRAAIGEALGPGAFVPPTTEVAKLTASDGAENDYFGQAVALSGDTALVGGHGDDTWRGAAYIFERDHGSIDSWGQVIKLIPSDSEANDMFGYAMAVSGDIALVGAPGDDDNGSTSGAAYVFYRDQGGAGTWGQVAKLTASDGATNDDFGWSVALSGGTALVGADYDDDNSTDSGSAYVFYQNQGGADNWGQVAKLTASDGAADDNFGQAVALSGDTALVGAYRYDTYKGSAYIFSHNQGGADNWGEVTKLTPSDSAVDDGFGESVALDGDTALVGAYRDDNPGNNSGSAYVFDRDQGGADIWGEVVKLTASDGAASDYFGGSVSLSGDTALVGAYGDDDDGANSGSAYLFERNAGGAENWGQAAKLTASDGAASDWFGSAVALSGDIVLVGAVYDDDNGSASGSAYLFAPPSSVGDTVWEDLDGDGVQEGGEPGLGGVTVLLYDSSLANPSAPSFPQPQALVAATVTAGDGSYSFNGLPSGNYLLQIIAPEGYLFSPADQGGDDALDSDANPYGMVDLFHLTHGDDDTTRDVGMYVPGVDSIGTFDPSNGNFLLRNTNDAGAADLDFLFAAEITDGIPLGGDWDGDYVDTIGVFSPSLGEFRLRNSNDAGAADITLQHNILKGGQPLVGDWDGDGVDTIGIFMDGKVYMRNTNSIAKPDIAFNFGGAGDIPLAGDWDGDGIDTIGVFDPVAGEFQLRNSNSSGAADITLTHKILKGATPITGDWDGDGMDTVGIYIRGKVFMRNTNSIGKPDLKFNYGGAGLLPVTGDWDGS